MAEQNLEFDFSKFENVEELGNKFKEDEKNSKNPKSSVVSNVPSSEDIEKYRKYFFDVDGNPKCTLAKRLTKQRKEKDGSIDMYDVCKALKVKNYSTLNKEETLKEIYEKFGHRSENPQPVIPVSVDSQENNGERYKLMVDTYFLSQKIGDPLPDGYLEELPLDEIQKIKQELDEALVQFAGEDSFQDELSTDRTIDGIVKMHILTSSIIEGSDGVIRPSTGGIVSFRGMTKKFKDNDEELKFYIKNCMQTPGDPLGEKLKKIASPMNQYLFFLGSIMGSTVLENLEKKN